MAEDPKGPAEKAEAPVEAPPAKPPLFSMVGWVVLVGVCLVEFVVVSFVGKMSHKEEAKEGTLDLTVQYWELDPFNVSYMDTVTGSGSHSLTMKLALGMDATKYGPTVKEEKKKEIESRMPKVRHEILRILQSQHWPEVTFLQGQEKLREEILKRMQEPPFPQDLVKEVCIESFTPQ